MKIMVVLSIVSVYLLGGCHLIPNGSSMDHAEAQKVSDSYMSDLAADRVDVALDKMETEAVQAAGGKSKC
jgi:hypothetical protein